MCCPISLLYWCLFHKEFRPEDEHENYCNPDDLYINPRDSNLVHECRIHLNIEEFQPYKLVEILLPKLKKIFKNDTCSIYNIIDILCKEARIKNTYS
jgi:hypothetical protein